MPKTQKENETTFNIVIDRDIYENLKQLAKEDSRSARNYITVLLSRHVSARMNQDNLDNPDFLPPGLRGSE